MNMYPKFSGFDPRVPFDFCGQRATWRNTDGSRDKIGVSMGGLFCIVMSRMGREMRKLIAMQRNDNYFISINAWLVASHRVELVPTPKDTSLTAGESAEE